MSCKCCVYEATNISCKNGVITVALADDVLVNLSKDELFTVAFKNVPQCDYCSRIEITDGTLTKNVAKNNQYFRPNSIPCNCDMLLCNKTDPEMVAVFCRWITPRGCR